MQNPGKLVIIGIVLVGLVAASLSVLYHRQSGRRALELWGTNTALLIARAPRVELLRLQPADAAGEGPKSIDDAEPIRRLGVGGQFYFVADTLDGSEARGLSNIRRAMVLDASYDWAASSEPASPAWQYAMQFVEGGQRAIVLFDFDTQRIGSSSNEQTAVMRPEAADDWRAFFLEQWDAE